MSSDFAGWVEDASGEYIDTVVEEWKKGNHPLRLSAQKPSFGHASGPFLRRDALLYKNVVWQKLSCCVKMNMIELYSVSKITLHSGEDNFEELD